MRHPHVRRRFEQHFGRVVEGFGWLNRARQRRFNRHSRCTDSVKATSIKATESNREIRRVRHRQPRKAVARKKLDEAKYPAEFKKSWRFTELLVTSENEQQQAHS